MGAIPEHENYRGSADPNVRCGTCRFYSRWSGYCSMFETLVDKNAVCDDWDPGLVEKGMAQPAELRLQVVGVHKSPDGRHIYRMETRDGHYVGRTNASTIKAVRGDVLKVVANDFRVNAGGDFEWLNPNVIERHTDRADSQRMLMQMAAGVLPMSKDTAPGPAGDIPPPGDETHAGPTLQSVHVDAPLANISLSYATKRLVPTDNYVVKGLEPVKQLVYGVVLEPNTLDSQDDYMLPDQVEKTAHGFLKKALRGKATVSRLQHTTRAFHRDKPSVVPVESFIAPNDFSYDGKEMIKKGSWVLVVHVEDPAVWDAVCRGDYTGFSIGGTGVRRSIHQSML